ncbi:MAG: protein kinase, partial [Chloroflexi bacterium]|nr:protein kinase [Chloroflexota bacterium]
MPEKLTLSDGAEVSLGRLISSGGEGAVYEIDGVSGIALKVYHEDRRTADRGRKLEAMLTAPPDNIQTRDHLAIAWPIEAVIDEEGRVAGFTMPLARDAQVLSELLNPRSRAEIAPDMTWQHMVNVAQNVSAVVDSLHSAGYVVGDLSERNFLVTRDALVTLIDCDSVQVPADDGTMFFSPVGTARFTAPELLGMDFESQPRTVEGDRFALAVLIFLILSEGYHPFQGVPADDKFSGDDVSAIRLGAYAYADRAGVLSPPPAAPNVESLPPVLAQLFERTFVRGHRDTSQRVAAGTWRSTLELIGRSLRTCSREPRHVFWSLDQQCPWCERAARIGADTWCLAPVEDHATSVAAPGLPPSASPPPAAAARQPRPSSRDQFVGALTIAVAGLFAWLLAFGLLSAGRGESPGGDPRVSQPTAIPSPNVTELAGAPPTATPSTGATGRTTVPTTGGSLGSRWIANTGGTGVKARTDCEAGASTSGDALVEGQSVTLDQIGSGRCSGWSRVVTNGSLVRRIW